MVEEETIDLDETPISCEETTEYDDRIEDVIEIEPELEEEADQEEPEEVEVRYKREEIEQQFARYERNHRARRIQELMAAPIKKKRGRTKNSITEAAA